VATYFRDFSSGDGISDFTEVPMVSTHTAPSWSIVNTDQVQATSASSHAEGLMWSDIDSDADRDDFEILGEVYVDSSSTTQRWYAGRVSASGSRTGYALRVRTTSIDIYHFAGSTFTSIVGATISITSGTWAWVRFRVNGTSVRARAWTGAIGDEPTSSWQCDSTDSTYSTAGHVGLLKANNTNTQLWRKLGIGTNGDTAPSSAGGGYTHPTLSAVTATEITATSFQPRVTYQF
jgi:hypothetical protein